MDDLPQTRVETANDLFRELGNLRTQGKITLACDFKRLQHMDSPVGSEAEGNIIAYGLLILAILVLWRVGWIAAVATLVGGGVLYYTLGQVFLRRRIRLRIESRALASLDAWQRLWRFGGVSLVRPGGETCAAPNGNWMALVRGARDN